MQDWGVCAFYTLNRSSSQWPDEEQKLLLGTSSNWILPWLIWFLLFPIWYLAARIVPTLPLLLSGWAGRDFADQKIDNGLKFINQIIIFIVWVPWLLSVYIIVLLYLYFQTTPLCQDDRQCLCCSWYAFIFHSCYSSLTRMNSLLHLFPRMSRNKHHRLRPALIPQTDPRFRRRHHHI